MGVGHVHGETAAPGRAGERHRRRLTIAAVLVFVFFLVEVVGGLVSNSLALLSDAAHMFTDVLGLGMALAAIHAATATAVDRQRSFGLYRLEILAALANAVLLFGVAGWILYEAVQRFDDPPDVATGTMLVIAVLGLAVNVIAFLLLRQGSEESLNVEAAYLEVLADLLGSVGVIVAAVVARTTGFTLIDPLFAVAIGLFVLPRTWRVARRAVRVLIQAAPPDVDVEGIADDLEGIPGVADVHDLHVWTLTSGMEVASAHLRLTAAADAHAVLDAARSGLRDGHDIRHATIQIEPDEHGECPDDCLESHW